jgi:hypothetical protein
MTPVIDDRPQRRSVWIPTLPILLAIIVFAHPPAAYAVPIGDFSFSTVFPGVENSFNISNFTGSFAFPPDFPVVDSLTFVDAELTAIYDGGSILIDLDNIGPGFAATSFLDTTVFLSATLTFTLSSLQFLLDDGTTFEAASNLVSVSLLPSTGSFLAPDDFVLIDVAGTPVTSVPEPSTLLLFGIGVLAWCSVRRRRMKAS